MMFDAESVREWNPSEMTLTAPVEYPSTSFAAATARLSPRTRRSTRPTSRWRAAAALALDSGTAQSFQNLGTLRVRQALHRSLGSKFAAATTERLP
jgi:hypothetical protein